MSPRAFKTSRSTACICGTTLVLLLLLMPGLRAEDEPTEIADNDTSPYHQALLNYKSEKYDAALTAINAGEKAKPDDVPTELLKARILIELHRFDDAAKLLKRLSSKTGTNPVYDEARILTSGDLLLRQHLFDEAAKTYESLLASKPNDSDLILKIIYARIGANDLVSAAKYASQLKPLDSEHPSYYFAKAALAQSAGNSEEAEQDIQTVRTIYGITTANRYLKTYLQVFTINETPAARAEPPSAKASPAPTKQP